MDATLFGLERDNCEGVWYNLNQIKVFVVEYERWSLQLSQVKKVIYKTGNLDRWKDWVLEVHAELLVQMNCLDTLLDCELALLKAWLQWAFRDRRYNNTASNWQVFRHTHLNSFVNQHTHIDGIDSPFVAALGHVVNSFVINTLFTNLAVLRHYL